MSPSSLPLRDPVCCFSGWVSCESTNPQQPAITINIIFSGSIPFVTCCPIGSFHILATTWATLFHVYFLSSWCSKLGFLASCRVQIVEMQKRMTRDGKHWPRASQSPLHHDNICIAQTHRDKWTNISGGSGHHPGGPKGLIVCSISHWLRSCETNIVLYVDYISVKKRQLWLILSWTVWDLFKECGLRHLSTFSKWAFIDLGLWCSLPVFFFFPPCFDHCRLFCWSHLA